MTLLSDLQYIHSIVVTASGLQTQLENQDPTKNQEPQLS